MVTTLFCQICGEGYEVTVEVPPICPHCGMVTVWRTAETATPGDPLTADDKMFLFSIRIAFD